MYDFRPVGVYPNPHKRGPRAAERFNMKQLRAYYPISSSFTDPNEVDRVKARAREKGMNISEYVRYAIRKELNQPNTDEIIQLEREDED